MSRVLVFFMKMENLFNEVWRPIKGYEGMYEVSNLGNVRSLDRYVMLGNHGNQYCLLKGKPMKPHPNSRGYVKTELWKNGQGKLHLVHRLVAEAFISNPNNLPCIDHINTIKTDNRVENLRWCTNKENMNNPLTREKLREKITPEIIEKTKATRAANIAKRPYDYIMGIGRNGESLHFRSVKEAAEYLGIRCSTLYSIMNGLSPVRDDFKIWFKGKEHLLRGKKKRGRKLK